MSSAYSTTLLEYTKKSTQQKKEIGERMNSALLSG